MHKQQSRDPEDYANRPNDEEIDSVGPCTVNKIPSTSSEWKYFFSLE